MADEVVINAATERLETLMEKADTEIRKAVAMAVEPMVQAAAGTVTAAADPMSDPEYQPERISGAIQAAMLPVTQEAFESGTVAAVLQLPGGLEAYEAAGGDLDFPRVLDPIAAQYLQDAQMRFAAVSTDVAHRIQGELVEGFSKGEGSAALAERVRNASELSLPRATAIARTEVVQASNAGTMAQARLFQGYVPVRKEWLATRDPRTRMSHVKADGQEVGLEEKFTVGGWPLDFPGDPTGPPAEVINCRCTVLLNEASMDEVLPPQEMDVVRAAAQTEETMPYHIAHDVEGCSGYAVVKDDDGEVMGCHDTEQEAKDQLAALHANEGGEADAAVQKEEWHAIIAPEGVPSGDGREFAPGALDFRDLPLPLRFVREDRGMHDGAVVVGNITRMERINGLIHGWGGWHDSEEAALARDLVRKKMQRWVSVDADDVGESDIEYVFPEGMTEDDMVMPELVRYLHARVAGATIVSIPAFQEAVIEDLTPGGDVAATGIPDEPEVESTVEAAVEEEDVEPTGAMVALVPDAESATRLFLEGGLSADDLHMTMVYLGQAADLSDEVKDAVAAAVAKYERKGTVPAKAFAAAVFNPDQDETASVLLLDTPEGRALREEVAAELADHIPDEAHDFIPHLTLSYLKNNDEIPVAVQEAVARIGEIQFDRLRVAFAGEVLDLPLDSEDLSLVAAAFPIEPPVEWFQNPGLPGPTPFTVDDDGYAYGHLALWGTCHTGIQGTCRTPPHESEFSYFQLGEVVCAGGERVPVGQITLGTGHAASNLKQMAAVEHYDHTGTAVCDVAAGTDQFGIWVAGAARPGLTEQELRTLRAAKLSGDWRKFGTKLRLVAALAVNVPGFPVPRPTAAVMHGEQVALVAAGIVEQGEEPLTASGRDYGKLAERIAASIGRDRKSRVAALAARLGRD